MKALAVSYLLFFFSFQVSAQGWSEDEIYQAWTDSGYSFEHLFAESGFRSEDCSFSPQLATSCLMALNTLSKRLPVPMEIVPQKDSSGAASLALVKMPEEENNEDSEDEEEPLSREEFKKQVEETRNGFRSLAENLFQTDEGKATLSKIILGLNQDIKVLSDGAEDAKKAYLAGSTYNTFLHETFDPHSAIVPERLMGAKVDNYSGIGAMIRLFSVPKEDDDAKELSDLEGRPMFEPMAGSPAEKAGLRAGDILLKVDGKDPKGEDFNMIINEWIKGPSGSQVTLTVDSRCGEKSVKDIVVTRGDIVSSDNILEDSKFVSLEKTTVDDLQSSCGTQSNSKVPVGEIQALYIPVPTFQDRELCSNFYRLQAMDLQNPDSVGLIVDLRRNPGGLVGVVNCMVDSLISDSGKLVGQLPVIDGEDGKIVGDSGAQGGFQSFFKKEGVFTRPLLRRLGIPFEAIGTDNQAVAASETFVYNRPVTVLVGSGSASASEIFAGSLQDKKRGWVVGRRTFGKGSVQSVGSYEFSIEPAGNPTTRLLQKGTTALYTLPSGRSPQGVGVTPDFIFKEDGTVEAEDEAFGPIGGEASQYKSIAYNEEPWVQTREKEIQALNPCVFSSESINQTFLKIREDNPLQAYRNLDESYQLELAKDILACEAKRFADQGQSSLLRVVR